MHNFAPMSTRAAALLFSAALFWIGQSTGAETAVLSPSQDNSLYESSSGSISNGAGMSLFAGRTGQPSNSIRRGLVQFDVGGSIPSGSTITSVELRMGATQVATSSAKSVALHRVTASWGEGTSNAGSGEGGGAAATTSDATWQHRFFDTIFWSVDGGDHAAGADASVSVAGVGDYTWGSNPAMVATIQGWLDDPGSNHGWLVKGDESVSRTAKRFGSREDVSANRPQLTIMYKAPVVLPVADFSTIAYTVNEGDGVKTITVTLDRAPEVSASVDYATSGGTALAGDDYAHISGTLHFTSVSTEATFGVAVFDDGAMEDVETLSLTLSNPQGCTLAGANNPAILSIISNDNPSALVYVDFDHTGGESGSLQAPYNTFAEGLATVTPGGTMKVSMGSTSETARIEKAMLLTASSGSVRIGVPGGAPGTSGNQPGVSADPDGGSDWTQLFAAWVQRNIADTSLISSQDQPFERVLPSVRADDGSRQADPGIPLAVRLRAEVPIDTETIWLDVALTPSTAFEATWQYATANDPGDVWVMATPRTGWPQGSEVTVSAGAGLAALPWKITRSETFRIEPVPGGARIWQPVAGVDYEGWPDEGTGAVAVRELNDGPKGPATYKVGPGPVFGAPQRVWLPIPPDTDPSRATLSYQYDGDDGVDWLPGEAVVGWLVPDSMAWLSLDGQAYIGVLMRHAGRVRVETIIHQP